jgi:SOS-response transcriptional repressor LexA
VNEPSIEGTSVLPPLTARQREVYNLLRRLAERDDRPPSLRYVAERVGISHIRVLQHLQELYRKGWLRAPTTDGLPCRHGASPEP